ncbi:MAG: hypothetical protein LH650_01160 [Chloroflexi bacterium]|nr:hypothetical protein [Chloroflexota bacterium]
MTVNRSDRGYRTGRPLIVRYFSGWRRPGRQILGSEVEAIGSAVTQFGPGDQVFGIRAWDFGTHAEYVSVRETGSLAIKPANVTYQQAAAVCDGVVLALNCLRAGDIRSAQRLLIQ